MHAMLLKHSHKNMRRPCNQPLPITAHTARRLGGGRHGVALRRSVSHGVPYQEGGHDARAWLVTAVCDLVVPLVQVAVLAHHEQGRHGAGYDSKVAAGATAC